MGGAVNFDKLHRAGPITGGLACPNCGEPRIPTTPICDYCGHVQKRTLSAALKTFPAKRSRLR